MKLKDEIFQLGDNDVDEEERESTQYYDSTIY